IGPRLSVTSARPCAGGGGGGTKLDWLPPRVVRELRSAEWYKRVLRLSLLFEEKADEGRARCTASTTTAIFGLVEHGGTADEGFRPDRTGLDHLAFDLESLDGSRRWAGHLDDLGIDHSGMIEIPAGAICNFRDPEGIQLAILWEKPT
ncbi:MAG: hypothetical protein M3144_02790, partial [Actinomycetota bacterium]|nr:hypothetical protein [Actinomycetota bacterium]